jgi:hypothetical protein
LSSQFEATKALVIVIAVAITSDFKAFNCFAVGLILDQVELFQQEFLGCSFICYFHIIANFIGGVAIDVYFVTDFVGSYSCCNVLQFFVHLLKLLFH